MENQVVLNLVIMLCRTLEANKINYCHWKSNAFLDRSASGRNDLDLLVDRIHAQCFTEILYRLGFKESLPPKNQELPGVQDFYGYDQETGRLVHVHAHFQLVLGSDLSKNYRLPIENAYLEASAQGDLFRVPAAEFELLIFVIRMVLKHSTWDSILIRHGQLSSTEQHELEYLSTPENVFKIDAVLHQLPGLTRKIFDLCLQSLQPGCPYWIRVKAGGQLQKALRSCSRYPISHEIILKFWRRVSQPILRRGFGYSPKNRVSRGGLLIAVIGGDGSGKTTVIEELEDWLSGVFEVKKLHMGKPAWSFTTITVRGILKIGTLLRLYPFEGDVFEQTPQPHGYPWFIRAVCNARDRYLTYIKARRFSANGKLVLCDRYCIPGFMNMDGPQCESAMPDLKKQNWFLKTLNLKEQFYYNHIKLPDLLVVLKVDPEIAVRRKIDETEASVRARSTEVFNLEWNKFSASLINANKSKDEILSQAKALVWELL
jgi:thymidylate kinase